MKNSYIFMALVGISSNLYANNIAIDKKLEKLIKQKTLNRVLLQKTFNEQLLKSARLADKEKVVELIIKGAHINTYDNDKNTPLMIAALYNNDKIFLLLLEAGANIDNKNNNGQIVIDILYENNLDDMINVLKIYYPEI